MAIWGVVNIVRKMPPTLENLDALDPAECNESACDNETRCESRDSQSLLFDGPNESPPHANALSPNLKSDFPEASAKNTDTPALDTDTQRNARVEPTCGLADNTTTSPANLQPDVTLRDFPFPKLDTSAPSATTRLEYSEQLEIEIGTTRMTCEEVQRLGRGNVISLEQAISEDVTLRNLQGVVAKGQMSIVGGKIAIRITERYST